STSRCLRRRGVRSDSSAAGAATPSAGRYNGHLRSRDTEMRAYEVKRGNVVEHDGKVWQIRDIERSSPQGRGGNVTFRFIMYSVPGGQKLDLSLRAEDDLRETEVTRRAVTYSYKEGDAFVFMDSEDFAQYVLDASAVGDASGYIADG